MVSVDLDLIALFPRLSPQETGSDTHFYNVLAEPIRVIPAISKQPSRCWKAAHESACASIVTDLPSSHEELNGPPNRISHCMQVRVHTALDAT
ncbi:hypothetical protein LY10_03913 [Planktotalea frisia]|uniref:Uncharacterized protein n=1 Tax=Planktotalea frisia TaxID=696762 RepID=A0A1L9P276_9RHOB|nr:hypothetical protein PFRI_02070 [Planktotalea frisia]PZX20474.1 hypothetical protein LY10_03913 [Planktotalea frisia]